MRIGIITVSGSQDGGTAYGAMIKEALPSDFEVQLFLLRPDARIPKGLQALFLVRKLFEISQKTDFNVVIKDFDSLLFLNKRPVKNIALIHHLQWEPHSRFRRALYYILEKRISKNLKRCSAVVVVSEYWKTYLEQKGFQNVYLVYNGFNLAEFEISSLKVEEFKKRYGLLGKPIVYIGNCQKAKGVAEAYEALKDLDVFLVSSGKPQIQTPAKNLELEYPDYLKLLKASSLVVTMSQFPEGWCRTAHEAMLLKIPVIGSGQGGMQELLEGGNQIICEDFDCLREKAEYLLSHSDEAVKLSENGHAFAKQFTLERFAKSWQELIKESG